MKRVASAALLLLLLAGLGLWSRSGARDDDGDPVDRRPPPPADASPVLVPAPVAVPADMDAPPSPSVAKDEAGGEEDRVAFRVDTVDLLTGSPVPSTWNFGTGPRAAPFAANQVVDAAAVAAAEAADREAMARWEKGFVATGQARPQAWVPANRTTFELTVRPPAGYVLLESETRADFAQAAGAHTLVMVVPVCREAVLDLRVTGPDDRPASGVRLAAAEVAGQLRSVRSEEVRPGDLRVGGIPFLPGAPFRATLEWNPGSQPDTAIEEVVEEVEEESFASPDVDTAIPDTPSASWTASVRLAGPTGHRSYIEVDNDLPYEESYGTGDAAPETSRRGSVRVKVIGVEGRPVAGAGVGARKTEADGEVLLEGIPVGERGFTAVAAGRLSASGAVVVREGQEAFLTLREPPGGRLEVLVTDESGAPRPSADVLVMRTVFDVTDGVQRVDTHTDSRGRRTFARVEAGPASIVAAWMGRRGLGEALLRDGETTTVRIVTK